MEATRTTIRPADVPLVRGAPPVRAPAARLLAAAAVAAQAAFVLSWLVAGALEPRYSHVDSYVTELAGRFAENPWIVRAGLVVFGLSLVALAPGLLRTLPSRTARSVTAALFVLAGCALALVGLLPLDCPLSTDAACLARARSGAVSTTHEAHSWLGFASQVLLAATPFALARALWFRPVALAALGAGIAGLAIGIAGVFLLDPNATGVGGLVERIELGLGQLWVLIVAAGILHATRREHASEPTPMPPREFFGSSWAGDGEVVPFPALVWRRFPLRLTCRRDIAWLSDDVGIIDDRVVFENGHVEAYRRYCHLVTPDRIHVSADDLPGGADLLLEEDGYRIAPFRMAVAFGPIRIPVRCREQHRLGSNGVLTDTLELRTLGVGLPVARVHFRVRRVDD